MQTPNQTALMALLAQAQSSGSLIETVPPHLHPGSLEEAYAVQVYMDAARSKPAAGYKIGMGSPAGIVKTGAGEPVVGRIAHNRLHASGATVVMPAGSTAVVEVEMAFALAEDGKSAGKAYISFEIVSSRLAGGPVQGWPVFIADDSGCHAVVVGDEMAFDGLTVPAITLTVDGVVQGSMALGDDAVEPKKTFASFAAIAKRHGWQNTSGM
ncbi:MAG: hypothetical protein ACRCWF_16115, partial [Beijerinckiaceae bacterium]